jgi:hypothetical protein
VEYEADNSAACALRGVSVVLAWGSNAFRRESSKCRKCGREIPPGGRFVRQSYPLPADAVPNLQKSVESPLDVEDEKLVAAADEALVEFHHGAASNRCDWVMSSEDGPLANTAHRGAIKELVAVAEIRSQALLQIRQYTGFPFRPRQGIFG